MKIKTNTYIVCFQIEKQQYALPLDQVERVIRMVKVSPLPDSPKWLIGVIDLQGKIVPVLDTRKKLNISTRKPLPTDRLIVINSLEKAFAITTDEVTSVLEVPFNEQNEKTESFDKNIPISFIVRNDSGMIMVLDIKKLIPINGVIT